MGDGVPASVWLVDKPAGPTSHDIVAQIRRRIGRGTRVGHAGTLDPFATGLLVVLVGRATRLAQFLTGLDKTYEAALRLGYSSATGDPEGPIAPKGETPTRDALLATLTDFHGERSQTVPAFAAVKVDGERLYRKARRGDQISAPVRPVTIHELELIHGPDDDGVAHVRTRVSTGTYIRQLATDIGETLGCGAYCQELRRTRVGSDLRIEDACAPSEVQVEGGVGLETAVAHLPRRELSDAEVHLVAHGRALESDEEDPEVALVGEGGLTAIARGGDGRLQPIVVLA